MKQNTITRAMTRCGSARILIINSKEMVNDAIEIHGLSPTCAAALGRTLTAASLIGVMLKNKTKNATIALTCQASDRQRDMLLAGGLLNYTRENA